MPRRNVFHGCSGLLDCKITPSFIHFIIPAMLVYLHASSIRARRYAKFLSEPQEPRGKGQALVAMHPEVPDDTDQKSASAVGDKVPHAIGIAPLPVGISDDMQGKITVARKFEHLPHRAYREREGDGKDGHESGRQVELKFLVLVQGVYEHIAGGPQKKPGLEMEKFIPKRNAVVEAADLAQEKREEDENDQRKIERERQIQAVALFENSRNEHQEENEAGAHRRFPIAAQNENADRNEDERVYAVIDRKRDGIAVAVLYAGIVPFRVFLRRGRRIVHIVAMVHHLAFRVFPCLFIEVYRSRAAARIRATSRRARN